MYGLPSRLIASGGLEAGLAQSFGNLQTPWNEDVCAVIRKGPVFWQIAEGVQGSKCVDQAQVLSVASAWYVL
jgi:hypothetical protein